jgi:hypothetical protein
MRAYMHPEGESPERRDERLARLRALAPGGGAGRGFLSMAVRPAKIGGSVL